MNAGKLPVWDAAGEKADVGRNGPDLNYRHCLYIPGFCIALRWQPQRG